MSDSLWIRSAARFNDSMACLRSLRSNEICPQVLQARPKIGMCPNSFLATYRIFPGITERSAKTSNQDWWLATRTAGLDQSTRPGSETCTWTPAHRRMSRAHMRGRRAHRQAAAGPPIHPPITTRLARNAVAAAPAITTQTDRITRSPRRSGRILPARGVTAHQALHSPVGPLLRRPPDRLG